MILSGAYLVTGVNGVGKSTLIREAVDMEPDLTSFSASQQLMARFSCRPGDYQALDSVPLADRIAASNRLIVDAIAASSGGGLLIDAHLLAFEGGVPADCAGRWVLSLAGVVVVTASPSTIDVRLASDHVIGRTRGWSIGSDRPRRERLSLIDERQRLVIERARAIRTSGCRLAVIDNDVATDPTSTACIMLQACRGG